MKKENIIRALVEKRFTKTVWKKITTVWKKITKIVDKSLSLITIRIMSLLTPIDNNKIIFLSFRGSYDCNPKWICEEILRRELPYQVSWSYKKRSLTGLEDFPESLKLVRQGSLDFFKELCSAKIIVDNAILMSVLRYRKKGSQCLIETWHGSLGIKRISKDAVRDKKWIRKAIMEGKQTDYIISNSDFESEIYRGSYWADTPILKFGHARNDILFELDTERVENIRSKVFDIYEVEYDTKICLYAPTFRNDHDLTPYDIDYEGLVSALEERFGGEWVVFTRFHFKVIGWMKKEKDIGRTHYSSKVIDVSSYPDIQELAVCTDVAITDYSSWICEYMVTRRPGFLFVSDLSSYVENDRSFYYPLSTLPFPVAQNNEQLVQNILTFDGEGYIKRCDEFLQEKGSSDDGHAAEYIVDKIEELMRGIC